MPVFSLPSYSVFRNTLGPHGPTRAPVTEQVGGAPFRSQLQLISEDGGGGRGCPWGGGGGALSPDCPYKSSPEAETHLRAETATRFLLLAVI